MKSSTFCEDCRLVFFCLYMWQSELVGERVENRAVSHHAGRIFVNDCKLCIYAQYLLGGAIAKDAN